MQPMALDEDCGHGFSHSHEDLPARPQEIIHIMKIRMIITALMLMVSMGMDAQIKLGIRRILQR